MDFPTAFWHLAGFVAPALGVAALAAALAKLAWFGRLRGVAWWRLAGPTAAVALVVQAAGLAWFGHDGKIATEAASCVACGAMLAWSAFRRG